MFGMKSFDEDFLVTDQRRSPHTRHRQTAAANGEQQRHRQQQFFTNGTHFSSSFLATDSVSRRSPVEQADSRVRQHKDTRRASPSASSSTTDEEKACKCQSVWRFNFHGLPSYTMSGNWPWRCVWASVLATCCVFSALSTHWVIREYLNQQTATRITVEQKQRTPGGFGQWMPIVVVCPKFPDAFRTGLLLRDIGRRLPHVNRETIFKLISFTVAGAGFNNVLEKYIKNLKQTEIERLAGLFQRWKGPNRSIHNLYKDLFERFNYRCEDLFGFCYYGYEQFNCCDKFEPYYMMLRGRCFKFTGMYQLDPDVVGRLALFLHAPNTLLSNTAGGMQQQIVFYLSNNYYKYRDLDIGPFPRFYIYRDRAVHIRVKGRLIRNLPNAYCSSNKYEQNTGTCFANKWLSRKVLAPLNCTLYYMKHKAPEFATCAPETVVAHFKSINDLRFLNNDSMTRCKPACRRFDHIFSLYRSDNSKYLMEFDDIRDSPPPFRIEVSFTNLEVERYEEVQTVTTIGFISQLGGQLGLFMGLSAGSIVQLCVAAMFKIFGCKVF